MSAPEEDPLAWRTLGDVVKARRGQLGLRQLDLANLMDVSLATVQKIEGGSARPKGPNRRALERALKWRDGSVDDVLRGGQPSALVAAEQPPVEDVTTVDAERAYEMLQAVRRVYGEEVYAEALARAVRARMSGEDRENDSKTA
ncbi:MAG TPA: helix-turn-helix domain-containing protein [Actinokineospora sp.]|nr:helix-turn-helix domain-containing protein [Actinokineospora sp.]